MRNLDLHLIDQLNLLSDPILPSYKVNAVNTAFIMKKIDQIRTDVKKF